MAALRKSASSSRGAAPRDPRSKRVWPLRLRLIVFFAIFLLLTWLVAAFFAWSESRSYIDKFFDTQQMLFAKTLLASEIDPLVERLPKTKKMLEDHGKKARGKQDKKALSFAVFTDRGEVLLTDGEKGDDFIFEAETRGFTNTDVEKPGKTWRMLWLASPDGRTVAAVGQELKYREKMALSMLFEQILPWLLLLPVLLLGLLWMLSRELKPLRKVARDLARRPPQDATPLPLKGIPSEVRPLAEALNSLFARIDALRMRERAFISDAAHELRTPLTGLRVQAEVVGLYADDPEARRHAVSQLLSGIDRCGRLVEQLLTLSRLEERPAGGMGGDAPQSEHHGPAWPELIEKSLQEHRAEAQKKDLALQYAIKSLPLQKAEQMPLLDILLRNLLDNAVKYSPPGGQINISLERATLTVSNSGPGVAEEHLARLGERFFRPPGNQNPGSGLGLSIVRQIADRYGLKVRLANRRRADGQSVEGFSVSLSFP